MPVRPVMSRDAKLAVAGTVCALAWSVTASVKVDVAWLRWTLALASVALPVTMWWAASRLRARGSARADAVLVAAFSAEFVVMLLVDLIGWAVAR
jgi:hypothetical protein